MIGNGRLTQRVAMRFGTFIGIIWILKFILFPLGMETTFLMLLFMLITLAIPYLGYVYLRTFRDKVQHGVISFAQGWMFCMIMYISASMLVAVAHYIYFQYMDHGAILDNYQKMLEEMKQMNMERTQESIKLLETNLNELAYLSPLQITFVLFSQNVLLCSFVSIFTALFAMRNRTR